MSSGTNFTDQGVHPLGWSTQELASFYNAASLLSSERLFIEIDYGLTDEGEPWLILCDPQSGLEEKVWASGGACFADQRVRPSGWSTQELALFYRAARLLSSEELLIETDHGLTDEGEPWFVLCDADSSDILGHFARVRDEYIACIPFCRCALRGWELPDLLSRFLRRRGIAWSTLACPIVRSVEKLAIFGLAILQCA